MPADGPRGPPRPPPLPHRRRAGRPRRSPPSSTPIISEWAADAAGRGDVPRRPGARARRSRPCRRRRAVLASPQYAARDYWVVDGRRAPAVDAVPPASGGSRRSARPVPGADTASCSRARPRRRRRPGERHSTGTVRSTRVRDEVARRRGAAARRRPRPRPHGVAGRPDGDDDARRLRRRRGQDRGAAAPRRLARRRRADRRPGLRAQPAVELDQPRQARPLARPHVRRRAASCSCASSPTPTSSSRTSRPA